MRERAITVDGDQIAQIHLKDSAWSIEVSRWPCLGVDLHILAPGGLDCVFLVFGNEPTHLRWKNSKGHSA